MTPEITPLGTPQPRGLSFRTILIILLLLALVTVGSLATLLYLRHRDKTDLGKERGKLAAQQARRELEATKAANEEKLAMAQTRQEAVLAQARASSNILGNLLQAVTELNAAANALKTNDGGRSVAPHADLVAQARRLYESELPAVASPTEIVSRLEAVRRIGLQLQSAPGTTYEPDPNLAVVAQTAGLWAEQQQHAVARVNSLLAALSQEGQVKFPESSVTTNTPTLQNAIDQLNQEESAFRQRLILERTSQATAQAVETEAQAEAKRIQMEAKLKEAQILIPAHEAAEKHVRAEVVRKAEGEVEDSKAKVEAMQKQDEARMIELRKRASDPEVRNKLAPFITPGYWQLNYFSYDRKPHSLRHLQGYGALDPTLEGLRKLGQIAHDARDKLRPRWKLPAYWPKKPVPMEKVKETQQLLIELGPALVEMKLLEP